MTSFRSLFYFFPVLGLEPSVSYSVSKYSATKPHPRASFPFFIFRQGLSSSPRLVLSSLWGGSEVTPHYNPEDPLKSPATHSFPLVSLHHLRVSQSSKNTVASWGPSVQGQACRNTWHSKLSTVYFCPHESLCPKDRTPAHRRLPLSTETVER